MDNNSSLKFLPGVKLPGLVVFYYKDYLKLRNQIEQYLG